MEAQIESIDLLVVPHEGKPLIVSSEFGMDRFFKLERTPGFRAYKMDKVLLTAINQGRFCHSERFSDFRLREPLTQETISAVAYRVETKDSSSWHGSSPFKGHWMANTILAGRVVETPEGIYTNTSEIDEDILKSWLNGVEKVNGIYLINDKMAFAPRDSYKIGIQETEEFVEGGLARVLEHTDAKVAENLARIASTKKFKGGTNVELSQSSCEKPKEELVCFYGGNFLSGSIPFTVGNKYALGFGYTYGVLQEDGK